MSFRNRISIAATVVVAIAVVSASVIMYFIVKSEVRGEIDDGLRKRAAEVSRAAEVIRNSPLKGRQLRGLPPLGDIPPPRAGGPGGIAQLVNADGATSAPGPQRPREQQLALPVSERTREVAAGETGAFFVDERVDGEHLRVYTAPFAEGEALQIARPLDEADRLMNRLAVVLLIIAAAGIIFALALGRAVSRAALGPVRRLMTTTEHVAATHDLGQRIEANERDELGRLAMSFNSMLEELDESIAARTQLVADASHELRTPLSSLKTNVEVLARDESLAPRDRERLLQDVTNQVDEYTGLVGDLIDLARGDEPDIQFEDVKFDHLVRAAVERARRHSPDFKFETSLEPCMIRGVPARLDRAVSNMLENAAKWSPEGGSIEVSLKDGMLTVRDHGPGFDEEDLPFVFDRFYRAAASRSMPGSGLGLAIVKQVAEAHGGKVTAENASDEGAILRLKLSCDS